MNPPDSRAHWWAIAILVGGLAMGLHARLYPKPLQPAQRDPGKAQPWMLEALPGIGPKTRDAATAAVRTNRIENLTKIAQPAARDVFLQPQPP